MYKYKTGYTFFADCDELGGNPAQLYPFVISLFKTAWESETVLMADRHLVACPNFRLALRTKPYADVLRSMMLTGKIQAAMMDGVVTDDNSIKPFSFLQFHVWFKKFDLWEKGPKDFLKNQALCKREMEHLDTFCIKQPQSSRERDPRFVQHYLSHLSDKLLTTVFGAHHAAYDAIARNVYADGSNEGLIRVLPYACSQEPNVHRLFKAYLGKNERAANRRKALLVVSDNYARSCMARSVLEIVKPDGVFFSPKQERVVLPFMEEPLAVPASVRPQFSSCVPAPRKTCG